MSSHVPATGSTGGPADAHRIRQATGADVDEVVALDAAAFGVDAWSEGAVRSALTGANRYALVARRDSELTGYAVGSLGGDVLDLQRIAVVSGERRTGLARRLFEQLRREGAAARAERMMLEVSEANEAGRAFYAACGFVELARRPGYYRDGSDALVMELPITAPDEDEVEAHLGSLGAGGPGLVPEAPDVTDDPNEEQP